MLRREAYAVKLVDNLNSSNTRMKNNLLQRQYDLYSDTLKRQIRFVSDKDLKYKKKLCDNMTRMNNFKKFQYDTEFELQDERLNGLIGCLNEAKIDPAYMLKRRIKLQQQNRSQTATGGQHRIATGRRSTSRQRNARTASTRLDQSGVKLGQDFDLEQLDSKEFKVKEINTKQVYEKYKQDIKMDLMLRFKLGNEKEIKREITTRANTAQNRAATFISDNDSDKDDSDYYYGFDVDDETDELNKSQSKPVKNNQYMSMQTLNLFEKNINARKKPMSIVVGDKSKNYFIYRLQSNGKFDPNVRQPIIKKALMIDHDPDRIKKYFQECNQREQLRINENQKRVKKFVTELEKFGKETKTF